MTETQAKEDNITNASKRADCNERLVPKLDADGDWTFTTDRNFKIMQLTDIHLCGDFLSRSKDEQALTVMSAMITAEKPDLIIVTGDIAFPLQNVAGPYNNMLATQNFIKFMNNLKVFYTVTLGNHDSEFCSCYNIEQIGKAYLDASYGSGNGKYCLFRTGSREVDGVGNQTIKIKKSNGIVTQVLSLFDTHAYTDGDYFGISRKYDNIHDNQLTWYKDKISSVTQYNREIEPTSGIVKSLVFFHIPIHAYRDAWKEFYLNGKKNTRDVVWVYGQMGDFGGQNASGQVTYAVYCGVGDTDNAFDAFLNTGSAQATFCGHDHFNYQALLYKGIQLTYSYSIDCLVLPHIDKYGAQRGCTTIMVNTDGTFSSQLHNYYQEYATQEERDAVTMEPYYSDNGY